jgi:myo-inositol-1(or 4)-monophosphatase
VTEPLDEFLAVCRRAAAAGGKQLLDWAGRFAVREKGPADLVTEADLASQEAVREVILGAFPDHGFLAEENGASTQGRDGYRWIVDPLDGTTNYVHGLAQYAVSIALERAGTTLVGVVFDPVANECFAAARGRGADVNGRPLAVSRVDDLSQAMVAASFPPKVRRTDAVIGEFLQVMERAQAVRRMGSSALNLCYVAAGRLDGYWAKDTKVWDVAAGWLLVREAGGVLTNLVGGETDLARPQFIAAATPQLHGQIRELVGSTANSAPARASAGT